MTTLKAEGSKAKGTTAEALMTREVVTVDKDDRLDSVLDLMAKHRVSKIPVVEKGRLVGVVTDGDVADELGALKNRGIATTSLHASSAMRRKFATLHPGAGLAEVVETMRASAEGIIPILAREDLVGVVTLADLLPHVTSTRPVRDVMVTELHAVQPTDRVIHARRLMLDHGVERLPVLVGGRVVGILGESDVAFGLAAFRKRFADHHQAEQLKRFTVEEIMVQTVRTTPPDTTVAEAARVMHDEHVGCLPVLQPGGKILGMVTRSDLVRTIAIG